MLRKYLTFTILKSNPLDIDFYIKLFIKGSIFIFIILKKQSLYNFYTIVILCVLRIITSTDCFYISKILINKKQITIIIIKCFDYYIYYIGNTRY